MHFGILGPLRVADEGQTFVLGGRHQRVLLATLLCHPGEAVADDSLIDALWGAAPPRTASKNLQVYVHQLRRVIGSDRVVRHAHGYSVVVGAHELDSDRFHDWTAEGRLAAARGDAEGGRLALASALDLWRGPVFADLDTVPALSEQIFVLSEQRLTTLEDRIELDLSLDAAAEVVTEAGALVRAHPMRERLRGLYMRALYRCGRQGEALQAFHDGRQLLADELGVETGEELHRIHLAILHGTDPGPPVMRTAGTLRSFDRVVPRQLPADPTGFTGRKAELDALASLVGGASDGLVRTAIICGTAGVGKTALAVHWARQVAGQFPDGQLYVNLRDHDTAEPMSPGEALAAMLRSLDIASDQIPVETAERASLYRSLLSDRRMLIVLDNARSVDQVRPLIPGGAGSVVLVTSRHRLGGLIAREGAYSLTLDVLSPEEATQLLGSVLGEGRPAQEPDAAEEVVRLCAYLPLALRIAAAQISESPYRSLGSYARELSGSDRLGALAIDGDEESAIRSAFDLSYATLEPSAQRMFRLLGVVPGPDFTITAVAALAAVAPEEALRDMSRLTSAHLVGSSAAERYAFHDLLREYAREYAEADPEGPAARERLFAWYQDTVGFCGELMFPYMTRLSLRPERPAGPDILALQDGLQALAWFDDELQNLVAAIRFDAEHTPSPFVWRMADGLRGYFSKRLHLTVSLRVAEMALEVAIGAGDQQGQAVAHMLAAHVYARRSDFLPAIEHLNRSHGASVACGWLEFELTSMTNLANIYHEMGSLDLAHALMAEFVPLTREMNFRGLPNGLVMFGSVLADMGREAEALAMAREAVELTRGRITTSYANALLFLGRLCRDAGRPDEAFGYLIEATTTQHALGDRNLEAWCLCTVTLVHLDAGRIDEAIAVADRAVSICRVGASPQTMADALNCSSAAYRAKGDRDRAVLQALEALELAQAGSIRRPEIEAMLNLAHALTGQGANASARAYAGSARDLARESGYVPLRREADALLRTLFVDPLKSVVTSG